MNTDYADFIFIIFVSLFCQYIFWFACLLNRHFVSKFAALCFLIPFSWIVLFPLFLLVSIPDWIKTLITQAKICWREFE